MTPPAPLPVAPDVHLVRSLPDGGGPLRVAINSLVIGGEEPVLVDTGAATGRDDWWRQVEGLVAPVDVRWIFLSHDDADHHGNLFEALERCPRATLVASGAIAQRLAAHRRLPLERCRWVNDGESFAAGGRDLVAVRPPAYDAPTTRGLFDVTSGVYWAADCFGLPVPHAVDEVGQLDPDVQVEGSLLWHRLLSPWVVDVDPVRWTAAIGRVAALDPQVLASAHGPLVLRRDVARALDLLGDLPGMPPAPLPGQADLEAEVAALAALAPPTPA
ncbi:MBL fold metallo-hydrolase [Iamia majanohamensis]|uniref:MBL fold metallo-hydrolase n=1 Tax=Iamia majanohamensis TaxID=467976 RepID=A0AAE9Y9J3_9ACTN|nr:MBL fold metallo-hydrolase [Iamia majanohamensis]WCO68296.1 MBL fold metallo-hydrolase [Iamia majanohamensis]